MQYRLAHGNLQSATIYSEKAAITLRDRVQPYFSKPLQLVLVEAEDNPKPQLFGIDGGRK